MQTPTPAAAAHHATVTAERCRDASRSRRAVTTVAAVVAAAVAAVTLAACSAPSRATPDASSTSSPGPHTPCPSPTVTPPAVPARLSASHAAVPDRLYAVDNHLPTGAPSSTPALVDVIDPSTDAVTGTIAVGPQPHHIYPVPGTNEAYVTHFVGCTMDVVDLVTDTVIGQVATGYGPRHLVFSPDGTQAYVIDYYGATLAVIDTRSNRTVATIATGDHPNYPAADATGTRAFVVNSASDSVTVAQTVAPYNVLTTVAVGKDPFDLALTPDGRTMVVTNAGDDTVSLIDTTTLAVTATIGIHPPGVGHGSLQDQKLNVRITADGRDAWVGDQSGSAFSVIDLHADALAAVVAAAPGADIFTPITAGPEAGLAVTTARYGTFLDVVDPATHRLVTRVSTVPGAAIADSADYTGKTGPAGAGSHMLVTNPAGTTAYVSDRPGGTVSVLDLTGVTPRLVDTITTSYQGAGFPDGLAYVHFVDGLAQ